MIVESAWMHIPVTVSIGGVEIKEQNTYSAILKKADDALYRSMQLGRNCVSGSTV